MAAWRRTWQPGAIDRIVADLWGSNRIYPVMQSALGKDRSARPLLACSTRGTAHSGISLLNGVTE